MSLDSLEKEIASLDAELTRLRIMVERVTSERMGQTRPSSQSSARAQLLGLLLDSQSARNGGEENASISTSRHMVQLLDSAFPGREGSAELLRVILEAYPWLSAGLRLPRENAIKPEGSKKESEMKAAPESSLNVGSKKLASELDKAAAPRVEKTVAKSVENGDKESTSVIEKIALGAGEKQPQAVEQTVKMAPQLPSSNALKRIPPPTTMQMQSGSSSERSSESDSDDRDEKERSDLAATILTNTSRTPNRQERVLESGSESTLDIPQAMHHDAKQEQSHSNSTMISAVVSPASITLSPENHAVPPVAVVHLTAGKPIERQRSPTPDILSASGMFNEEDEDTSGISSVKAVGEYELNSLEARRKATKEGIASLLFKGEPLQVRRKTVPPTPTVSTAPGTEGAPSPPPQATSVMVPKESSSDDSGSSKREDSKSEDDDDEPPIVAQKSGSGAGLIRRTAASNAGTVAHEIHSPSDSSNSRSTSLNFSPPQRNSREEGMRRTEEHMSPSPRHVAADTMRSSSDLQSTPKSLGSELVRVDPPAAVATALAASIAATTKPVAPTQNNGTKSIDAASEKSRHTMAAMESSDEASTSNSEQSGSDDDEDDSDDSDVDAKRVYGERRDTSSTLIRPSSAVSARPSSSIHSSAVGAHRDAPQSGADVMESADGSSTDEDDSDSDDLPSFLRESLRPSNVNRGKTPESFTPHSTQRRGTAVPSHTRVSSARVSTARSTTGDRSSLDDNSSYSIDENQEYYDF